MSWGFFENDKYVMSIQPEYPQKWVRSILISKTNPDVCRTIYKHEFTVEITQCDDDVQLINEYQYRHPVRFWLGNHEVWEIEFKAAINAGFPITHFDPDEIVRLKV
tara:strand:- start:70 stop:387 length:318 start_codon:yes stop_codon:yes gene_type:complete